MDWFLPQQWTAALGAPIPPMTWWSWHDPSFSEPATDERSVEDTALELELVAIVYGVLAEDVDCAVCGAPLDRSVEVALTHKTFKAVRIVVVTRCQGSRGHRHVARAVEGAGELRFGQLGLDDKR